jgi:hypothetical protein
MSLDKENTYGDAMADGFDFKFDSNHKPRLIKTQKQGSYISKSLATVHRIHPGRSYSNSILALKHCQNCHELERDPKFAALYCQFLR